MAKKKNKPARGAPSAVAPRGLLPTREVHAAAAPPPAVDAALDVAAPGAALRLVALDVVLLQRLLLWGVLLAFFISVRGVWVTLLFVGVLAFLGDPLVRRLQKRGVARPIGALIVVVGGLLALASMLALVLPALLEDLVTLAQKLPALLDRGAALIEARFGVAIPTRVKDLSAAATGELLDLLMPMATGGAVAKTVSTGVDILQGAASALGTVAQTALVPVLGYFLLAELPETLRLVLSFVPARARPFVAYYRPRAADALARLVRGQILVAGFMTALYVVGLTISGVPLALAVAILSGAAYLIPFASASVCFVLATALSLLELGLGAGGPVLGTLITCVAVQLIEGYVLTPRIVGEQAGLSPLAALLAVLLGGAAAGFLGVLFAMPIGCVLALVLREEAARRGAFAAPESA